MKLKLTQIRTINRYVLLLVAMFVFSWSGAQAQSITVTGNVTDESGAPLTGVSVIQKGTAVGVVTDGSGKYSINTNASATLLFQYIGYSDQEIAVGGKRVIDVSLAEDVSQIDEVVVVAYGTKKKRDMIGSVAKVKSEDLSLMPGGNFITSLQGKAAGVQIVNDGIPGSNPQIKVRGISSISSGTDPLWVVDGIVGGDYGSVNFHDIESIEVLKDASATAIYGSRGSNGVIIVTTKRGKKGDPIYNVTYNTGVATLTKNDIGMGTTSDYFAVLDRARAARGLSPLDPQKDVIQPFYTGWTSTITRDEALASNPDYKDMVTRNGSFHDLNVSISQGGEKSTTYASFNYRKDVTNLVGRDMDQFTGRLNSEWKKGILTTGVQINGRYRKSNNLDSWNAISLIPWVKVYDENDPSGYWNPRMNNADPGMNPMAKLDSRYNKNTSEGLNVRANVYAEVAIPGVKGLAVRGDASFAYGISQSDRWMSKVIKQTGTTSGDNGNTDKNTGRSEQYHLFAKYNREFGKHGLDIVTGIESSRGWTHYSTVAGRNLSGAFQELAVIGTMEGDNSAYLGGEGYTFGFFNRLDYKFMNRYLVGVSYIHEGSSKFDKANRWGDFFSASAGWIISDENFLKSADWISLLKIRGSYGETGNQNIPSEATQTLSTLKPKQYYNGDPNMYVWTVGNRGARWEKTKSIDLGLDFGLFNNRVNGSVAYYRQNVNDMLTKVALPASAGIPNQAFTGYNNSIWANIGSMRNQGVEVDLNVSVIQKKDFSWNTNINLTTNNNEVMSLDPNVDVKGTGIINTRPGVITKKGLAVGTYFMAEWAGVDSELGIPLIYEIDLQKYKDTGETVKTGKKIPATLTNVNAHKIIQEGKSALPTLYAGWNNNFTYKNFDLSFSLYLSTGNYIYNRYKDGSTRVGDGRWNMFSEILNNSWQKPGDIAEYPELRWQDQYNIKSNGSVGAEGYGQTDAGHTKYLEKADYLRLRDLTFGYTLPERISNKVFLSGVRFYVSASNLFTITNFSGWDPEIRLQNNKNGANSQGIVFDGGQFPQVRTFSAGVSLKF